MLKESKKAGINVRKGNKNRKRVLWRDEDDNNK
jgi:hypothetical protein